MKNITQTLRDVKQAYLNYQQEQMLALYQKAQPSERKAIIKNIDSFLSVISTDEKTLLARVSAQTRSFE